MHMSDGQLVWCEQHSSNTQLTISRVQLGNANYSQLLAVLPSSTISYVLHTNQKDNNATIYICLLYMLFLLFIIII